MRCLDRHGVLTRGAVAAEDLPGGFAAAYRTLDGVRGQPDERGARNAVEGLGAAQFAVPGAVDRLRADPPLAAVATIPSPSLLLAATDPANPYGAALAWPGRT